MPLTWSLLWREWLFLDLLWRFVCFVLYLWQLTATRMMNQARLGQVSDFILTFLSADVHAGGKSASMAVFCKMTERLSWLRANILLCALWWLCPARRTFCQICLWIFSPLGSKENFVLVNSILQTSASDPAKSRVKTTCSDEHEDTHASCFLWLCACMLSSNTSSNQSLFLTYFCLSCFLSHPSAPENHTFQFGVRDSSRKLGQLFVAIHGAWLFHKINCMCRLATFVTWTALAGQSSSRIWKLKNLFPLSTRQIGSVCKWWGYEKNLSSRQEVKSTTRK